VSDYKKKQLWTAIHDFVRACGGDPDSDIFNPERAKVAHAVTVIVDHALYDARSEYVGPVRRYKVVEGKLVVEGEFEDER